MNPWDCPICYEHFYDEKENSTMPQWYIEAIVG